MKLNTIIYIPFILIAFTACKQQSEEISKDELRRIVEEQNSLLGNNFIAGNADNLASLYTESAKLCPDGMNFIHGRDSIKMFWANDFKTSKTLEMKTKVFTVDGNLDIIYETGKSSSKILYNDSIYCVTVKYINVWRKQPDGCYQLDIDFWNRCSR